MFLDLQQTELFHVIISSARGKNKKEEKTVKSNNFFLKKKKTKLFILNTLYLGKDDEQILLFQSNPALTLSKHQNLRLDWLPQLLWPTVRVGGLTTGYLNRQRSQGPTEFRGQEGS